MGREYKNPPIYEATCEFRFVPGKAWDVSFPDQVQQRLAADFPKKQTVQVFEASLTISSKAEDITLGQQPELKKAKRLQARSEDGSSLMIIDADLLAISHLTPYPGWKHVLPLIERSLAAYREVAEPKGVHRIGLRYINRIEIPGSTVKLDDYFKFFPSIDWQLSPAFTGFAVLLQFPFDDRDFLNLQLASLGSKDAEALAVLLDLDYFLAKSEGVAFDQWLEWLEQAHQRVEEGFEGCIRDSLRELFGEGKN
ncbi:MAG: TIGR04255 family protein [Acidobacteria bacterium]|nr:TIGR04255 family protein [Acidobacteriota bacterium]MCW5969424.1 TIGR04255 family protein [Blastocatellales bacterium]